MLALLVLIGCGERVECPPNSTEVAGGHHSHASPNALVTASQATHTAVASGDWSDAATWGGAVPGEGARVIIPGGVSVRVDGELAAPVKTVGVSGALTFAEDVDTLLWVDTLVTDGNGTLQIGTPEAPISPGVTAAIRFADDGPIDTAWDADQLSRGALLQGPVVMAGAEKTPFMVLARHPLAGDDTLQLSGRPVGWRVGDALAVAATDPDDPASDEVRTIAAISGNAVTLSAPLQLDHAAPRDDLDVHVANLTRNILLISDSPDLDRRGHVMFMHNLDVSVSYASFVELGRTDKTRPVDDYIYPDLDGGPVCLGPATNRRGRYSVHFHQGGTDPDRAATMVGSVVVSDPGWAYVNHSSNVDFIENVSYDVVGGAFQTESGDEIGSFVRNLALRTIHPDYPLRGTTEDVLVDIREEYQDYAFQGDAFWLHGGGVAVEGNIAAGVSGHAYIYWPEGLIEPHGAMVTMPVDLVPEGDLLKSSDGVDIWLVPVASFSDNTAYAATKGLEFYYLHTTFLDDEENPTPRAYRRQLHSTFEGLTFWGMHQHAIGLNYTENVTFRDVRIVGDGRAGGLGIDADHFHNMGSLRFEDLAIADLETGISVPTQGDILISGGTFANQTDLRIMNPQLDVRSLHIEDVEFEDSSVFSEQTAIEMAPDFTLVAEIQDGLDDEDEGKLPLFFLLPDRITLDFGELHNVGLYYAEQEAGFVPMREKDAELPETDVAVDRDYIDLTNKQLQREHEMSFGGTLLPDDAVEVPGIAGGLVGPLHPAQMSAPETDL